MIIGYEKLEGHFIVIKYLSPYMIEYVALYDTVEKAQRRAKQEFTKTGHMVDVYQLKAPLKEK
jgi:hypothetical protein